MTRPIAAAVACAALLTGCNGYNPFGTTQPPGCGPEPALAPALPIMVYPVPGATGVPASLDRIVLSAYVSGLQVSAANGTPVATGSPAPQPSPVPSPNAVPTPYPPITFIEVPIGPLAPATAYTVSVQAITPVPTPPCSELRTYTFGSFTTQ